LSPSPLISLQKLIGLVLSVKHPHGRKPLNPDLTKINSTTKIKKDTKNLKVIVDNSMNTSTKNSPSNQSNFKAKLSRRDILDGGM
jgi:hypothetical protein